MDTKNTTTQGLSDSLPACCLVLPEPISPFVPPSISLSSTLMPCLFLSLSFIFLFLSCSCSCNYSFTCSMAFENVRKDPGWKRLCFIRILDIFIRAELTLWCFLVSLSLVVWGSAYILLFELTLWCLDGCLRFIVMVFWIVVWGSLVYIILVFCVTDAVI